MTFKLSAGSHLRTLISLIENIVINVDRRRRKTTRIFGELLSERESGESVAEYRFTTGQRHQHLASSEPVRHSLCNSPAIGTRMQSTVNEAWRHRSEFRGTTEFCTGPASAYESHRIIWSSNRVRTPVERALVVTALCAGDISHRHRGCGTRTPPPLCDA